MRARRALLATGLAALAALAGATRPDAAAQGESLLQIVLRFSGIAATPSAQKGPGDELEAGDVWIATVAQGTRLRLTRGGGYRSPVFGPGDGSILALRQSALVTIPLGGGEGATLHALTRPSKLVGLGVDRPQDVLAVFEDPDGTAWLGLIALGSGQVTRVPHDRASREDRAMIAHARDWQRVYGGTSVYARTETKQGLSGIVEWTDVYVARPGGDPVNVSRCDGVSCGQPSLARDGSRVVFVQAAR